MAMHEVAVIKAIPIARTTSPGSHAATVPGSHMPGAHAGAPSNSSDTVAAPTTSHVTSTTASVTVSGGQRGYQCNC